MENPAMRIAVTIVRREDGGLYVYSDDLPGFVLSHLDADAVLADIEPALKVFLGHVLKYDVDIKPVVDLRESLIANGIMDDTPMGKVTHREYVGIAA